MITLADVLAAQQITRPHASRTPLVPSRALGDRAGCDAYLKLECWQRTGSFKLRGALNKLAEVQAAGLQAGPLPEIVTASAGNHGLGVAYAGQVLGLPPATIFVPEGAPAAKVNRLAAFQCHVRRAGADYDACHALAEAYARKRDAASERRALYLSAYDDPVVVAGQGTAGLEILEDQPGADLLLVPVGGGGLIAGLAIVAKATNPKLRVIGLQPDASPAAYLSLRDGRAYETYDAGPTICDGLAGGFGRLPFEMAGSLIDEIVVVPEPDIRHAVAWLATHEQLIVEGAGAIAVAPLLSGQLKAKGRTVVAVLSGRNLDAGLLREILEEHPQP